MPQFVSLMFYYALHFCIICKEIHFILQMKTLRFILIFCAIFENLMFCLTTTKINLLCNNPN